MAKKIYSMFCGRWSCDMPHAGHIALIRTELDKNKNVCIAIRDTNISEKDPYTVRQRVKMFKKVFKEEYRKGKIKIIKIPDIECIVYGRGVGYEIKQVRLSPELEAISGTKIRKKLNEIKKN